MVDFNDRRLTELQKNPTFVRPDIKSAVDTHISTGDERRVSLSFNGERDEHGELTRYRQAGYLRADESGNPVLFPNSRSTKGRGVDVASLHSIDSSRKDRKTGALSTYWARQSGPYSLPEK